MAVLDRLMATTYDRFLAPSERAGLARHRHAVLEGLSGHVLEIGAGTGLNLDHYPVDVTRLTITEPSPEMRAQLEAKLPLQHHDDRRLLEVIPAAAEDLPFDDHSLDHVVSTLVLCTVGDPVAALAEIHRVLKPGGTLRLVEHVASDQPSTARAQRLLRRPWKVVARGCDLHRDTRSLLEAAGFDTAEVRDTKMPGPPIVQRAIAGTARPR